MHTIDSLIRESCLNFSEDDALCFKAGGAWRTMTYGQLWSLSDRIGAGLLRQGFAPGDHAALLAPASPQWVAAYLAVLKVGGVVVPVDKELKSAELRHILADCDARLAFCDVSTIDVLLDVIPGIPDLSQIITLSPLPRETVISDQVAQETEELLGEWKSLVNRCGIPPEHSQRIETLAGRLYGLLSASSGAAGGRDMPDPFAQIESTRKRLLKEKRLLPLDDICHTAPLPEKLNLPDHTAVILYTSGTTGRSKGAMLSHANIVSNIKAATAHFGLDRSISTLSFLPINHVFEQVCGVLLPLSLGGKVTFCESLKKLGENLAEIKPTFFLAVPAVYRMLLDRIMKNIGASSLTQMLFNFPLTRPLITSKIRRTFGSGTILISGGAALDPAIAAGLGRLGLEIYQGYGITETSPIISAEHPGNKRLGTVGHLIPGVGVRIENPNEDQVGEIAVRGPNVMQGYYKNEAATAEVIHDGWYRTGDLGRLDRDRYLTICGRVKNMIVTPNGKNVYPEEVENELLKSPFIAEAMVYGHRVGQSAEEVHAVIYPNQEALDLHCSKTGSCPMTIADVEALIRSEVQTACSALADYKRVRKITLRDDEFPKTTTRKIKRFAVEARISTRD